MFTHRALVHAGAAPPRLREFAFVACIVLVLTLGVVGVLLLNTAMQQQAHRMAAQQDRIATLAQRVQDLRQQLDWQSDPARLAAKARELNLRPVTRIQFLSEHQQEARRVHAS